MPRTFSRGQKLNPDVIFELITFIPPSRTQLFLREARLRYCQQQGLDQKDIPDLLDSISEIIKFIINFRGHMKEFHLDRATKLPSTDIKKFDFVEKNLRGLISFIEEKSMFTGV